MMHKKKIEENLLQTSQEKKMEEERQMQGCSEDVYIKLIKSVFEEESYRLEIRGE